MGKHFYTSLSNFPRSYVTVITEHGQWPEIEVCCCLKVKVKFTPEQVKKTQTESRCIALLFL